MSFNIKGISLCLRYANYSNHNMLTIDWGKTCPWNNSWMLYSIGAVPKEIISPNNLIRSILMNGLSHVHMKLFIPSDNVPWIYVQRRVHVYQFTSNFSREREHSKSSLQNLWYVQEKNKYLQFHFTWNDSYLLYVPWNYVQRRVHVPIHFKLFL